jgi:hypothetical protein
MVEGPFQPLDEERAERIAAKRMKWQKEQFPLFADQLPVVTGAAVKAAADRHAERFAACLQSLQERGDAFREQVRERVSAETFAELERRESRLPQTPEYHADFWRRQRLCLDLPCGSDSAISKEPTVHEAQGLTKSKA